MKKLKFTLILLTAFLAGCTCIAQIPPQIIYVDKQCQGIVPDFRTKIEVRDNCELDSVWQVPAPGALYAGDQVRIYAVDKSGNASHISFDIILLDTIPPSIFFTDTGSVAYTDHQIETIYNTWMSYIHYDLDHWINADRIRDTIICYRILGY